MDLLAKYFTSSRALIFSLPTWGSLANNLLEVTPLAADINPVLAMIDLNPARSISSISRNVQSLARSLKLTVDL